MLIPATPAPSSRAGNLAKRLREVLSGKAVVKNATQAKHFLEAIATHAGHETPVACLQAVFAKSSVGAGAKPVADSVRTSVATDFVKTSVLPFVAVLAGAADELQIIADGHVLRAYVAWLLKPPELWHRLVGMFHDKDLADNADELLPFAWLVNQQLVRHGDDYDSDTDSDGGMSDDDQLLGDIEAIMATGKLMQSVHVDTRALAHQIQKRLTAKINARNGVSIHCGVDTGAYSPGGRHDNDHADIARIQIYPTNDELVSDAVPFYRRTDEVFSDALADPQLRAHVHIDNQFRLLREDMLAEIRDDLKNLGLANGKLLSRPPNAAAPRRKPMVVGDLTPVSIELGTDQRGRDAALNLTCGSGLHDLCQRRTVQERYNFLKNNTSYLKHKAVGVFIREVPAASAGSKSTDEIIAFAVIDRDLDGLSGKKAGDGENDPAAAPQWRSPVQDPVLSVRFTDGRALGRVLLYLRDDVPGKPPTPAPATPVKAGTKSGHAPPPPPGKKKHNVRFAVVGSAVFSYEYVLEQLKSIKELALARHIVFAGDTPREDGQDMLHVDPRVQDLANSIMARYISPSGFFIHEHRMQGPQIESLVSGLTQPLTVIQGPPGTGKSFIGAQIVRMMVESTETLKILVITYTNHALDQFLEDLIEAGVSRDVMVRLGGKSTDETRDMLLSNITSSLTKKFTPAQSRALSGLKLQQEMRRREIQAEFARYYRLVEPMQSQGRAAPVYADMMEMLEFSESDTLYFGAFEVPDRFASQAEDGHGFRLAQRSTKPIVPSHLFNNWRQGKMPGIAGYQPPQEFEGVWAMPFTERAALWDTWMARLVEERISTLGRLVSEFTQCQNEIERLYDSGKTATLLSKRVIACTTTSAAKNHHMIEKSMPDVVLVEEAGEILESHVLAALASPTVKQLVLIGDHQQLRPRYNNYALTVEKDTGYNFNMSMFERLIKQGCPFVTLEQQHRMHVDISVIPRTLTYPQLKDGPGTGDNKRPPLRGLRDRVVFMNHEFAEASGAENGPADRFDAFDAETKTTKSNPFEADMCVQLVRYLAQQGYKTTDMVILTPYVGQLRLILDTVAKQAELDPLLNDLDTAQLLQLGLLSDAEAKASRGQLRISTIDNYQGEESDIVIGSLTRSNTRGDIGFMASPERLNVLCTRARNCLVLIGNMNTFMNSFTDKGRATWSPFFRLMRDTKHLYDGIPVRCDRHPDALTDVLLKSPQDFALHCPDGGCSEPCGILLACGQHACARRCHWIDDHSKMPCPERISVTCARGHKHTVKCTGTLPDAQTKNACKKCTEEDKARERQIKRNLELEAQRLARRDQYAKTLLDLDDEIAHLKRTVQIDSEEKADEEALRQKEKDLELLKDQTSRLAEKKSRNRQTKTPSAPLAAPAAPGSAQEEWEWLKTHELAKSEALDELMGMTGLEDVKKAFLSIKSKVDTALRQGLALDAKDQRYGCSLLGNPGTGKTTVARIFSAFLAEMGVIPSAYFKETTGARLAHNGVGGCETMLDDVLEKGGGVVFIDEAYQLTNGNSPGGNAVLDFLLPEVENLTGKVVFLLAGYDKEMESFFAHNPGLPSRFPITMTFADYTDAELLSILTSTVSKKWSGNMKWELGPADLQNKTDSDGGLYMRVVSRRIGRGRGRPGFGNARTVQNGVAQMVTRQAKRLRGERRAKLKPDDFFLTKEDMIGPEPGAALAKSQGWTKLQALIGTDSVKQSVRALLDSIKANYHRELAEESPIEFSLNKVFLGSPGTGKTTVAKLYGQILCDLGMLSNGEVLVRNPSDFVGSVIGGSEKQTKGILAASAGKVLVIDEAYGLYGGGQQDGGGDRTDTFRRAVIDTLVAEIQSVPGEDRCVLLLGYTDRMEEMLANVNPGLARRFPIASGFVFEDFTEAQMAQILNLKLRQQSFVATAAAKKTALEVLARARTRPNFGNAGEIDILLDAAKVRHQKRLAKDRDEAQKGKPVVGLDKDKTLLPQDMDPDFDRADKVSGVRKLFAGMINAEEIICKLEGYKDTVTGMRQLGMDDNAIREATPFNFVFRGPPGTGKTTVARFMGQIFYDMGFLAGTDVIECSASNLIGQYIGHTGPKVIQQFDKALGRVLFVDEAYRLAEGHFAQEAIDEFVDCTTKERYRNKMVIVLAGYDRDMNRLMQVNEGLSSRFPESISFRHLGAGDCVDLLRKTLAGLKKSMQEQQAAFDISVLDDAAFTKSLERVFDQLMARAGWANSRDVKTLAQTMYTRVLKDKAGLAAKRLVLGDATVRAVINDMLVERANRDTNTGSLSASQMQHLAQQQGPIALPQTGASPPAASTDAQADSQQPAADANADANTDANADTDANTEASPDTPPAADENPENDDDQEAPPPPPTPCRRTAVRDAGVSDAVWEQLQRDKAAEDEREREYQALKKQHDAASEADRDALVRRLIEEERRRKEEAERKKKIAEMGKCPVGYEWIKQASGYRCAGGSHFLTDQELE